MKTRFWKTPAARIPRSRWLAYATASAATTLAGAGAAEGAIHYSGLLDVKISAGTDQADIQIDQPGDSLVFTHHIPSPGQPFAGFSGRAKVSFFYVATSISGEYPAVKNLPFGASIAEQTYFRTSHFRMGRLVGYGNGEFFSPGIAYIGFVFRSKVADAEQYGWVRVRMRGEKRKDSFEVIDFAYGDPGELVTVGQTSDEAPTSGMGSLGLLAAGAAGLVAWRKNRNE